MALSGIIGANVITNTLAAEISGSTVTSGTTLDLAAQSSSHILSFTGGVAVGSAAGLVSLSANVITDTTKAGVVDGSLVNAGGAITISATDMSIVDALGFGVSGGGGSAGMAVAGNVVANTTGADIAGSTITTGSTLSLAAESSAIIRTVTIGVSLSAGFSAQFTVIGNEVTNTTVAEISGSTVTAAGDLSLSATELAPSTIDPYAIPASKTGNRDNALANKPASADLAHANILALVINVAGSGGVAANVTVLGNRIANIVDSQIDDSTVKVGVTPTLGYNEGDGITAADYTISPTADVSLTTLSSAKIIAVSAGFAASGLASLNALVVGNLIDSTVDASITGSSTVHVGGGATLSATDSSGITALGLSFAASGGLSGAIVTAKNDIGNTVSSTIGSSTVITGGNVSANATENASILSFVGGVAVSGTASAALSLTINNIHNTVETSIEKPGTSAPFVNAGVLNTTGVGAIALAASDTSTIDSIAIGLSASTWGAAGAAIAKNFIGNTVTAGITDATVSSDSSISLTATSSAIIRSLAAGLSGAGLLAVQGSLTLNQIGNTTTATISNSIVTATGAITVSATDTKPSILGNYMDTMAVPGSVVTKLTSELTDSPPDPSASIVSFAGSVGGAGLAAGSAAVSTNDITNTIRAEIADATVTSTGSGLDILADSDAKIVSVAAGVGFAGAGAVNASETTNTIDSDITADVSGESTVSAAGDVTIGATDVAQIASVALSLAGAIGLAVGGAVVDNTVSDETRAYAAGTSSSKKTKITQAGSIMITADSDATIAGASLGVSVGTVAAGAVVAESTVGGSTEAYLGDHVEVGQAAGKVVNALNLSATSDTVAGSEADAVSAGVAAGTGADAQTTVNPTVSAGIGGDASVAVSSGVSITAQALADANATAVGAVDAIAGAGGSVAKAALNPDVDAYIGASGTTTSVTAGSGGITLKALDNYSTAGVADTTKVVNALAQASSGGLVTGSGADADATAAGSAETAVRGGATLSASGGAITLRALAYNSADADSKGLGTGAVGVGVSLADATAGGTFSGTTFTAAGVKAHLDGTVTSGSSLTITTVAQSDADADAWALSAGLAAGAGANAQAYVGPDIAAGIGGGANVSGVTSVAITAQSLADGDATATGYSGAVAGAAGSVAGATVAPDIDAYIGSTVGTATTVAAGSGGITVKALHNYDTAGTAVNNTITALAKASSGGLVSGSGADADAVSSATTEAAIWGGTTLNSGTGDITVWGLGNNLADADAKGLGAGAVGIGVSLADATASGSTKAHLDGGVSGGRDLNVKAIGKQDADANAWALSAGLAAGSGADATATASPTVQAYLGDTASVRNITLTSGVTIIAQTLADADAGAVGYSGAVAGAAGSVADAYVSPTVDAYIGAKANVSAGSDGITVQALHNYNTDGTVVSPNNVVSADAEASSGGGVTGSGAFADAVAAASTEAAVRGGATLRALGGGAIKVESLAYNSADADAAGVAKGLVGVGATEATAVSGGTFSGTTFTADIVKAHLDGGVTSGGTVTIRSVSSNYADADSQALSAGLASGTGAKATAYVGPDIDAGIGGGASVTGVTGVTITAQSLADGDATATGNSDALAGAAGSIAGATVAPDIDAYIGSTSGTSTTVTAGSGGITVKALHNYNTSGNLVNNVISALAEASSGGLVAGSGADADAISSAGVESAIWSGTTLSATGGAIDVEAWTYNNMDADSKGNSGGLAGVGVSLANATIGGTSSAHLNGTVSGGTSLTVQTVGNNVADADAQAVAKAGIAGSGSSAQASVTPTISAYVAGGSHVTVTSAVTVRAKSVGYADALAIGQSFGALAAGGSVASAAMRPDVDAYIGASGTTTSITAGAGGITVQALHNYNETSGDATVVNNVVRAEAQASSGAIVAGSGADADATSAAGVESGVRSGTTLSATGGAIKIETWGNNNADADAKGISGGLVGVGVSDADALAGGYMSGTTFYASTERAHFDGNVTSGASLSVTTVTRNLADADAQAVAAAGIAGSGANGNALVRPTIDAYIAGGSTVNVTSAVTVRAQSVADGDATAIGQSFGALAAGGSVAASTVRPDVDAYIGASGTTTNVTAGSGGITVQALHNYQTGTGDPTLVGNVVSAEAQASSGALIAGSGATAAAASAASVESGVRSGTTLSATGGAIKVETWANNNADADAKGISGGLVGVGVSDADALAGGYMSGSTFYASTEKARLDGNVTSGAGVTVRTMARTYSDANAQSLSGGLASGAGADSDAVSSPIVESGIGSSTVNVTGAVTVGATGEIRAKANSSGVTPISGVSVGSSLATATAQPQVTASLGSTDIDAADITVSAVASSGDYSVYMGRADSNSSSGSLLAGIDLGTNSEVTTSPTVSATVGASADLDATHDLSITSSANASAWSHATGETEGLLSVGDTNAKVTANTSATTTIGSSAHLDALHDLTLSSSATTTVSGYASGGAGKSLIEDLKNLFTGNFDAIGIPSFVATGGALTQITVNNTSSVTVGSDAHVDAENVATIAAYSTVSVDADTSMTAGSAIAASAISGTIISVDSDATITIGDRAEVEGREVVINAQNRADVNSYAYAHSTADIAGAFASAVSRVTLGSSADHSEARVTINPNAKVTGIDKLTLTATNQQLSADIVSHSYAWAQTNTIAAIAGAEAGGTVTVDSVVETKAGSELKTVDLTVTSQSAYNLQRNPETKAQTVVWFETIVKTVQSYVCDWMPWPFDAVCNWVFDTITEVVEHVTGAVTSQKTTGAGVVKNDQFILNGNIILGEGAQKRLTVEADGTVDTTSNITPTITDTQVVVPDIINNSTAKLTVNVPTGTMSGSGSVYMNKIYEKVDIDNYSSKNLVINNIQMMSTNGGQPDLHFNLQPGTNWKTTGVTFVTNTTSSAIEIENHMASDIIFMKPMDNFFATYTITNDGGDILAYNNSVVLSGAAMFLTANSGTIGTVSQRLNLKQTTTPVLKDGTTAPLMPLTVSAQSIYLGITAVSTKWSGFVSTDRVSGFAYNFTASSGPVDVVFNQGIEMAEVLGDSSHGQQPYNVDGTYYVQSAISGSGNVSLNVSHGDLLVGAVSATGGTATLTASGSILEATAAEKVSGSGSYFLNLNGDNDAAADVTARNITMTATAGTIGTSANDLEIDSSNNAAGKVNAWAPNSIYLTETMGSMGVGLIESATGDVTLRANSGAITDFDNDGAYDVKGDNVTLWASGGIGVGDNALDIESGMLTISGGYDLYLIEVTGDLTLNSAISTTGNAFLSAPLGSILDGRAASGPDITADGVVLVAAMGVGTSSDPIETQVGNLEANAGTGGIWIDNDGSLTIGGINPSVVGLTAGGAIVVTAFSPLTVNESVTSGSNITLTAVDDGSGDNLTVNAAITCTGGFVDLRAGDNFTLASGVTVSATGTVYVRGDYGDTDATGSTIALYGHLVGSSVQVSGGDDDDLVIVTNVVAGAPMTVSTGAGDDTIYVGSNATPSGNSGGNLNAIAALLTVDGGTGSDQLLADETGETTGNTGSLTATSLTGLGMGGSISYSGLEALTVSLGSGADTFTIASTHTGTTTLNAGGGNDTVRVKGVQGSTTVNGEAGDDLVNVWNDTTQLDDIDATLTVNGGSQATGTGDRLVVSDTGNSTGRTGTLTGTTVTGLGMGGQIDYGTQEALTISLGSGADSFTIASTHTGTTTLNAGGGNDTIRVKGVQGSTTVNGEAGDDLVNVWNDANQLDDIDARLTVNGGAQATGTGDRLVVSDTGNSTSRTGTLTGTTLTGLGMGDQIVYGTQEALTISLGSGADTFTIASTHAGTTTLNANDGNDTVHVLTTAGITTVNGGAGTDTINVQTIGAATTVNAGSGDDTINVGSLAPATGGTLNGIDAALTINGEGGSDTLNTDATGDTLPNTGTLTGTTLTGLGMAVGITYGDIQALTISLGSGADTFTIASTHAGTTTLNANDGNDTVHVLTTAGITTVNGGAGTDTINVQTIGAATTVNAGSGDDTINVGSLAPATAGTVNGINALLTIRGDAGSDTLNVDDTGDAAANTGILAGTRLTGLGMGSANQGVVNPAGGIDYGTLETLNISLGSGADTFTIESTHPATTNLATGAGDDTVRVKTVTGTTNVNTETGNDTVNVWNDQTRLDGIGAVLTIDGDGNTDAGDILNISDAGYSAGRTGSQAGILTGTTLNGLGMAGHIVYAGQETLNITLGSGGDEFTVEDTHIQLTNLFAGAGNDVILINAISGMTNVFGGNGDDRITVDTLPSLFDANGDGIRDTLNLHGEGGSDTYIVNITGSGDYIVNVLDNGTDAGTDTLTVNGTENADTFLLRASQKSTGIAFIAALHNYPVTQVERINYDKKLEGLTVDAQGGDDTVTLDDNWTPTTIRGGAGADTFQVGQIFKSLRDAAAGVAPQDVFETTASTRGYLSNGVSYATTIDGGAGDDQFQVFRNKAILDLEGGDGDDTFTIRAFAKEGSTTTNVKAGRGTRNKVSYVINAPVNIDGGDGIDTLRVIGTEFPDQIVVTKDGIYGMGITVSYTNVERLEIDAAEGDDEIYVLSTGPNVETWLYGGLGSDRFSIAGDVPVIKSGDTVIFPATAGSHKTTDIAGTVHIDGAAGAGTAGGLGTPVMLPGETNVLPSTGPVLDYTGDGTSGSTDHMTVATADLQKVIDESTTDALTTLADLVGRTIEISQGTGLGRFWQITAATAGEEPGKTVLTLKSPTMPAGEWDLPNEGGTHSKFAITHLASTFFVIEETQVDFASVYNDASTSNDTGDLTKDALTGLGMGPGGMTYGNLETLEVFLGSGNDNFTVDSSMARSDGYRTVTMVNTGAGDDTVTVSLDSASDGFLALNTEAGDDTVDASTSTLPLVIFGGAGDDSIQGGQGSDIIFGDRGRIDYRDNSGTLITRLGIELSERKVIGPEDADQLPTDVPYNQTDGAPWHAALVTTRDAGVGGADTIVGNGGSDILLGGAGNDRLTAGDGVNIILGDNGNLGYSGGSLTQATTSDPTFGGADTIRAGVGTNLVLAGAGGDSITAGDGTNVILGDHGTVTYQAAGVLQSILSTDEAAGGADQITLGSGNNTVVGGTANDKIEVGQGTNVILGDSGSLTYGAGGWLEEAKTTTTADGAADDIDVAVGTAGNTNLVLGGQGGDTITAGGGTNVILGDHGTVTYQAANILQSIVSTDEDQGGADQIAVGAGTNTVVGGTANDSITTGQGGNVVLGDSGQLTYATGATGGWLQEAKTTTTADGAADEVDVAVGTSGNTNLVLGGQGGDTITAGSGTNIVLGDHGVVTFQSAGVLGQVLSTNQDQGGADQITLGSGTNTVVGGTANDTIASGTGTNVVLGDSGSLTYATGGWLQEAKTTTTADGAADHINLAPTGTTNWNLVLAGQGNDTVTAGAGTNIILGDHGVVTFQRAGVLGAIASSDIPVGGADSITLGNGVNTVVAGTAGDTVTAGQGANVVLGDSGSLTYAADGSLQTAATQTTDGAADTILLGAGTNLVLGGQGGDTITAGDGINVILGDHGVVTYRNAGVLQSIVSTDEAAGGADTIRTGLGGDIIVGGAANDDIHTGDGNKIVIGDSGRLVAAAGTVQQLAGIPMTLGLIETTAFGIGGADAITTGSGDDIVLGGHEGDNIKAGDGNNIVLGDDGSLRYDADNDPSTLDEIQSTSTTATGGADTITTGNGNDIVIGGRFDDTINAGSGNNIVLGDSGRIAYTAGLLTTIETKEPTDGGIDTITTNGGNDVILGGQGDDVIKAGDGANIVLGDNGRLSYSAGVLNRIETTDPSVGGKDQITSGTGNDIILGGAAGDTINAGDGNNIVLGDNGYIDYVIDDGDASDIDRVETSDPSTGGADSITTGTGDDLILGGADGDIIHAGAGNDLVLGDFGSITLDKGIARKAETADLGLGAADTIYGGDDDDVLVGGDGDDVVDGGAGRDLIFGDNVSLDRSGATFADYTNPRFRTLSGGVIYDANGDVQVDSLARNNPSGNPVWANWDIDLAYGFGVYGNDYLAGGAGDDMIFGQMGDDTIQGDGSIDGARVAANRNADGTLSVVPSFEVATDGDDYIEGNGGTDVIFGNLGQDDIIGGNSNLFGLTDPALRHDGNDLIFGGAGIDIARNDMGDTSATGHARDADMILGDNGNIFRLVGSNGAYLQFNYDNYGSLKIIPRAAELLDYTPGGLDYTPTATQVASDIGGDDEIHGESGDDFIYGQVGTDVLFGEGQDDDIVGGYGNDWISGGTGDDGVLGDDGRIYTSRNSATYGEPLYGVAALLPTDPDTRFNNGNVLNEVISTPGKIQQSVINVGGELKKTVNLTPFKLGDPDAFDYATQDPQFADDIIYGGLGNDSLHGGAGDDAISGAEALPEFYGAPANPGDVLGYGDAKIWGDAAQAGEFAAYDEYNPLVKIQGFLLNFDPAEGAGTDGEDALFGDTGNDWLVGGTGKDHLYGGYGDDLLNADDNQDTAGGLNNAPDTNANYEDIAYGGGGRDVLIANTGGDRLIDWAGEFNSFLVPFAPFGMATVSRALQPQIPEYLYALSANDGADPTRAADTNILNANRNGEPEGELGLVKQQDQDWQNQTGAPADPQPGNIPGGSRDVLRSATFNAGTMDAFFTDSGSFKVEGGMLKVSAESLGGDAVSVFNVDKALPTYYEIQATITAAKPTAGWKSDSYVIFDYQSKTDFKFAGINVSTNKFEMGHRTAAGWIVDAQANVQVKPDTQYNMLVAVNGTNVTVTVNGKSYLSYTFAPRVENGWVYGLNTGMVGVGSDNSRGTFDNIAVQVLPPKITFEGTESFPDTNSTLNFTQAAGTWQTGVRYVGTSEAGGTAISLADLGLDHGFVVSSVLELTTTLQTQTQSGVIFDYYAADNFKYAAIDAVSDQLIIGHYTKKSGWVTDAKFAMAIDAGKDYDLTLSLKGTTVSLSAKQSGAQAWQGMAGFVYNAVTVDGSFGLFSKAGASSFDAVTVKTDDPAFRTASASASLLASSAAPAGDFTLTYTALDPIIEAGISRWTASGLLDPAQFGSLVDLSFVIADLGGSTLALAEGNTILIDRDAAGYGWFVDTTPTGDSEFKAQGRNGELLAPAASSAAGDMDLLTVVMHEIGHVLGYGDLNPASNPTNLMSATLEEGIRRLPADLGAPLTWDPVSGSLQALDGTQPLAGVSSFAQTATDPATPAASPQIDWTAQYAAAPTSSSPANGGSAGDPILPPVELQVAPDPTAGAGQNGNGVKSGAAASAPTTSIPAAAPAGTSSGTSKGKK